MIEFKDTEIGTIPEDWELANIGSRFDIKQGKQLSAKYRHGANQKCFLRTSNVFWGKLNLTELDKMHFSNDETKELELKSGDLLVCEGGEIGRTAIWQNNIKDCYYQNHLHRLRAKDNSTDAEFYMYWMMYGFLVGKVYFGLGNITTIPNLSQSRLKSLLIPTPPIPQQHNIAYILSEIQSAIETQEKIIQTTAELKKALMQKVFTEGLKGEPQKETEIGKVPKNWEIKKLGDYATLITKGASPKWQGFNYCENGVMFIRSQNIGWGDVIKTGSTYLPETFNKTQKRSILKADDVLVNLVGASIGRVAVAPREFEGANINQAVALVRVKKESYLPKFIMYFLLTDMGQFLIKRQVKAIARGNISLEDVSNFFVPMPTISEQEEIVNTLTIIDEKHKFVIAKKQILINLCGCMLHHLMTGQIRVKDIRFS